MTRRTATAVYGSVGVVAGIGAVALTLTSDHEPQAARTLAFGLVFGWSFLGAGLIAHRRRPDNATGRLMVWVAIASFLGALSEANDALLFTVGEAASALVLSAIAHLVLAYPSGRVKPGLERWVVGAGYVLGIAANPLEMLFRRNLTGCADCPRNLLAVTNRTRLESGIEIVVAILAAAVLTAAVVLLARRWRAASAAYRRSMRAVLLTSGLAMALLAVGFLMQPVSHEVADALAVGALVAFSALPYVFLLGLLRVHFAGAAVGRLVARLGPAPLPGQLRDALRDALHDPTLDLGYWLPDLPGYVDIDGRAFDPREHGAATFVDGESGRIGVLVHDPALLEERALLNGVVAATRLALENERLHAELRARVAELERERDFTRLVVDTAPAYFCVVDAEGRVVRFNATLAAETGARDDDAWRGRPFWELFSVAEEASEMRAALSLAAVAGRGEPHEQALVARTGERRTVSWSEAVIPDAEGQLRFLLVSGVDVTDRNRREAEQAALRVVATLVASGAPQDELFDAVTAEVGRLFDGDVATTLRRDSAVECRVVASWSRSGDGPVPRGTTFAYDERMDTPLARALTTGAPARIDGRDELTTPFGVELWNRLGVHASIAAPVVLHGEIWGAISTTRSDERPFPPGAEQRLDRFAALLAQAIANAEARRELAGLAEEQATLRRVATLVAGGRAQDEVLEVVAREAGELFGAQRVNLVRWAGVQDEVVVVGAWSDGAEPPLAVGARFHPSPTGATLRVLETGYSARADETSLEIGPRATVAAPVIVNGVLWGALNAMRIDPFAPGTEERLRRFADLVAQSIANEQAQEELRASRARIVAAADEARRKLERNLHDGAQQRLVAVSISLRLAAARLTSAPESARPLLAAAADELTQAIDELRELARGIHPAVLTDRGLGPALEALASRAQLPVDVQYGLGERLPPPVEAAAYYVVSESLANVAKYAEASEVSVRVSRRNGAARVEVEDDGVGGADPSRGSGLRGLADRVEALDGRLGIESETGGGTRVWAEIPVA